MPPPCPGRRLLFWGRGCWEAPRVGRRGRWSIPRRKARFRPQVALWPKSSSRWRAAAGDAAGPAADPRGRQWRHRAWEDQTPLL